MRIENGIIIFKSDPENFNKERIGDKRNTVRVIPESEIKQNLTNFDTIQIINSVNDRQNFYRKISDISTMMVGETKIFIFSW